MKKISNYLIISIVLIFSLIVVQEGILLISTLKQSFVTIRKQQKQDEEKKPRKDTLTFEYKYESTD